MTVRLDPADLAGSVAAAQAALVTSDEGSVHEWVIPAPSDGSPIELAAPLDVGAPNRSLLVRGETGVTQLRIAAGPAADGDPAAGIRLSGREVELHGVSVTVDGDDDVHGIALVGTVSATIAACTVRVRGERTVGVAVTGSGLAEVVDVEIVDVRATAGDAIGLDADGETVRVHRVTITDVVASGSATGLRAGRIEESDIDVRAVTISAASVARVDGRSAVGVRARSAAGERDDASPGPAEESVVLLDVAVTDVGAGDASGSAVGIDVAGDGDIDVRGATARSIDGPRAFGARLLAGGAVQVTGGVLGSIAGGAEGAVGLEVAASASPEAVVIEEVQVEAVHAVGHADRVAGIRVVAPVSELAPWVGDASPPGVVHLGGCVVRRISGTAIDIDADLRDVSIRGVEVYAAARAGTLRGERVIVSETTWHRLQTGLHVGPCALTFVSSLVTGVAAGLALVRDGETETVSIRSVFGAPADPSPPLRTLPDGLPYVDPGPAGVPVALAEGRFLPVSDVDLRLAPPAALHEEAVPTPGDPPDRSRQVGAHPPPVPAACDLRDPLEPAPAPADALRAGGPVVDRLARDGRGLLGVMQARADAALPGWVPGDPADLTTTLFELMAHRLDRISYRQDAALSEASMASARLRRSVEAHARLVDYEADPGLSATTMIELRIPSQSYERLGLVPPEVDGVPSPHVDPFTLAADTVVVNPSGDEAPVVVSTDEDLVWYASLADLELDTDLEPGGFHAELRGDVADLEPGRWLVLVADADQDVSDADRATHVVRATVVERGADRTLVYWDPRRPAPGRFAAGSTVLANVTVAHHGVRVSHRFEPPLADDSFLAEVEALRPQLELVVPTRADETVEVALPLAAASRVAPGWPFPGAGDRAGRLEVEVEVDGEPWRLVEDVALEPGEVFAVVPSADGGSVVRLGQPGTFTGRTVQVTVTGARLGVGSTGNVAEKTLTSLVALGRGSTAFPDDLSMSELRTLVEVENPVPGIGGRDPEPLERVRRAAPWIARRPATAVTTADYETLLTELDEVAGARARVLELGERRLVEVTMLLADEDTLVTAGGTPRGDVDLVRDAERLRRWGLARRRLEEIRLMGFDVVLVPPTFVPLDLDVLVDAESWASAESLYREVTEAIAGEGGLLDPDRTGLGGDVHVDGIMRSVLAVGGVASARVRRLRRLEAGADEHAVDGTLPVGPEEVAVVRRPYGDGTDGVLTVEVCGGIR